MSEAKVALVVGTYDWPKEKRVKVSKVGEKIPDTEKADAAS